MVIPLRLIDYPSVISGSYSNPIPADFVLGYSNSSNLTYNLISIFEVI